jgi:hypothetical protein
MGDMVSAEVTAQWKQHKVLLYGLCLFEFIPLYDIWLEIIA